MDHLFLHLADPPTALLHREEDRKRRTISLHLHDIVVIPYLLLIDIFPLVLPTQLNEDPSHPDLPLALIEEDLLTSVRLREGPKTVLPLLKSEEGTHHHQTTTASDIDVRVRHHRRHVDGKALPIFLLDPDTPIRPRLQKDQSGLLSPRLENTILLHRRIPHSKCNARQIEPTEKKAQRGPSASIVPRHHF